MTNVQPECKGPHGELIGDCYECYSYDESRRQAQEANKRLDEFQREHGWVKS